MEQNDHTIIRKSQQGNLEAFGILVEKYQGYAYNLAFKILAHEEDAKDTIQEAFIRIWKNIKKYNLDNKFTTWMYKIVVNLCLDNLKMKKRRRIKEINEEEEYKLNSDCSNGDNPDKNLINKEIATTIRTLTKRLTPKQRIVFVLYFIYEHTIEEIKTLTGMAKGNIKSNLYYARKNMRILLEKNEIMTHN